VIWLPAERVRTVSESMTSAVEGGLKGEEDVSPSGGGDMHTPTRGLADTLDEARSERDHESVSVAWVADILRDQRMPRDEIEVVLTTDDPILVHRHIELHRERLEEWFDIQRRTLAALEGSLTEAAGKRHAS
jgi:hypothetical protein